MGRGKKRRSPQLVEQQTARYVPFFSSQRQQPEHANKKLKTSRSAGEEELIATLLGGGEGSCPVEHDSPPFLSTLSSTAQQLIPDTELIPDPELCPPEASVSDNPCTMHYSGLSISTTQLLDNEKSTKLSSQSQQQEECPANSSPEQLPIQTSPHILQPSSPFPNSTHCTPPFLQLSNLSPSSDCSSFPNLPQPPCSASPVVAITTKVGHHSCTPTTVLVACPAGAVHSMGEDAIGTEQSSFCEGEDAIGESGEERGREASTAEEGRELYGSMASLPSGQAAQPNCEASGSNTTEACLGQPCLMKDPPQPPSVLATHAALPVTPSSEGSLLLQGIIQELSKLNECILRSKRELNSVRLHYSRGRL